MLAVLILAIFTLFAPRGAFGKALLLFNACITLLCFWLAAEWNAQAPQFDELGIQQHPPSLARNMAYIIMAASLVLGTRCFYRRPPKRRDDGVDPTDPTDRGDGI